MGKGTTTKERILAHAMELASTEGVQGLSLGRLAERVGMSKSGLFAHFRSKEELQLQVLESAADSFRRTVSDPARRAPAGVPRFRELFDRWLAWNHRRVGMPGGCLFTQAATELDDQPGAPRDFLVESQNGWQETLVAFTRSAIRTRAFREDVDVELFVFQLRSILLGETYARQLLGDSRAEHNAKAAFEALLASAINPS